MMFKENKLPKKAAFSCLLWEMGRGCQGLGTTAGLNSAEWALDFVCTCSPAGLMLYSGCPCNGYASKYEQGSLFIFIVFSRRC